MGSLLGHEKAEEAMRLVAYPGSEKQPTARSSTMIVTKPQRPQPVVLDCMSIGIPQEADELAAVGVVHGDLPAPGIADKQMVAEGPKVC